MVGYEPGVLLSSTPVFLDVKHLNYTVDNTVWRCYNGIIKGDEIEAMSKQVGIREARRAYVAGEVVGVKPAFAPGALMYIQSSAPSRRLRRRSFEAAVRGLAPLVFTVVL